MKPNKSLHAFTLVELLVVVAVIAILAAIALPNFLEAQARSKISRAKADMRSIVTALEAYVVDNNNYPTYHYVGGPLAFHMGGQVPDFGVPDTSFDGRIPLTTPIAYITNMPQDPFASRSTLNDPQANEYHYVNWPYAINSVSDPSRKALFFEAFTDFGSYRIHSLGPDGDGPDTSIIYDPTNGSTSNGDVYYAPKTSFTGKT